MMGRVNITAQQARRWRLGRHWLDARVTAPIEDVVGRAGAVSAWPVATPELAVAARRGPVDKGALEGAVKDGRLIKAYAFRGAVHLMTPDSASLYLTLRASGRQWERRSWQAAYGLAPGDWPAFRQLMRDAVADQPLTRHELSEVAGREPRYRQAAAALVDKTDTLLKPLMWQGDVCFGAAKDGHPTLQSFDRVPGWNGLTDVDTAGRRAVEMFIGSYGPTTADRVHYHVAAGLSAGRRAVDRWLEDLGGKMRAVSVDGRDMWMLAGDLDGLHALTKVETTPGIRLISAADPWILGSGTADPLIVPPGRRALLSRGVNPVLARGEVAGTWAVKSRKLTVTLFPDRPVMDDAELFEECARAAAVTGAADYSCSLLEL